MFDYMRRKYDLDDDEDEDDAAAISKVGSAYICKICKYMDLCIFCILIACLLHIFDAY